jgi:hypothetical protein
MKKGLITLFVICYLCLFFGCETSLKINSVYKCTNNSSDLKEFLFLKNDSIYHYIVINSDSKSNSIISGYGKYVKTQNKKYTFSYLNQFKYNLDLQYFKDKILNPDTIQIIMDDAILDSYGGFHYVSLIINDTLLISQCQNSNKIRLNAKDLKSIRVRLYGNLYYISEKILINNKFGDNTLLIREGKQDFYGYTRSFLWNVPIQLPKNLSISQIDTSRSSISDSIRTCRNSLITLEGIKYRRVFFGKKKKILLFNHFKNEKLVFK